MAEERGIAEGTAAAETSDPVETIATPEAPSVPTEPTDRVLAALADAAELAQAGGPVIAILAAMSVFALAIVLAKLFQFTGARIGDRRSARDALALYRTGRPDEALARARQGQGPTAQVLSIAMGGKALGIADAKIREECYAAAQTRVEALRGWMRPLEVIASLAPLLGLFGTVLGMIEAFGQLEAAGSQVDPAILSGGIWEALLTTAAGLAVSIPVVAAANWFERRIERVEHDIDTGLATVFAGAWRVEKSAGTTFGPTDAIQSRELGTYGLRTATAGE
ncbi:MAG: MotA/TolQ/ExbB proton channel family protein [Pseudomonadota bacterium]